ncbi:resolvase domain-containing protein [Caballeronia catudaia]|uniref:Resolvase domain-containing protein n=1 Tax=Caballeronia catudaia TaxID=1777136 RepID=A0A157Z3J2_9BURK|nr:recombinase family protein [Caballeronia catudaia]SAK40101.1 resolvase domain-containing protein [Caballeronia catudaia]
MRTVYYGRISTTEGQTSATQYDDAKRCGVDKRNVHIDEGISGYHVAPSDRPEWKRVMDKLSEGGVLHVRWLDRISRRYDELSATMRQLMEMGVKVVCSMNGMEFDGTATSPIAKATRDAVLAFIAAQGEADYMSRRELQKLGIESAKARGQQLGAPRKAEAVEVQAWRVDNGASIAATAAHFGLSVATVKRYCAEVAAQA